MLPFFEENAKLFLYTRNLCVLIINSCVIILNLYAIVVNLSLITFNHSMSSLKPCVIALYPHPPCERYCWLYLCVIAMNSCVCGRFWLLTKDTMAPKLRSKHVMDFDHNFCTKATELGKQDFIFWSPFLRVHLMSFNYYEVLCRSKHEGR